MIAYFMLMTFVNMLQSHTKLKIEHKRIICTNKFAIAMKKNYNF